MRVLPDKREALRVLIILTVLTIAAISVGCHYTWMPGSSYRGELAPLDVEQTALARRLRAHVEALAADIGQRNISSQGSLELAAAHISDSLKSMGYEVNRLPCDVGGIKVNNIEVVLEGTGMANEVVVVGAHYDTAPGTKGANDNASGVAGVLELGRMMAGKPLQRTVRLVFFANEEPPYFQTDMMGAFVYALGLKDKDVNVVAMLSLETIGYYSDQPGSQQYPFPFSLLYPNTGNFIGFVSTTESRKLIRKSLGMFRRDTDFPSEGAAIPAMFPGADWSDHWAFMVNGYEGIMITDTAPYRYAHYHTSDDTPEKLDCRLMAQVVTGIGGGS
jgi:hypothetical protein